MDAGVNETEYLVLYIGNANPSYGLEELIKALPLLSDDIHVGFLGYMPDSYKLLIENLVSELNVELRFHFLNPVSYEKLPEYASEADLGVIALHRDVLNMELCLPNRFFDFVMARLPIATSKIPAIENFVNRYELGQVFDEKDPVNMAKVISDMLKNENIQKYKKACEKAARILCWENEQKKLLAIVEDYKSEKRHLSICIFARKNIWRTNRVTRMAHTLNSAGHHVTVLSPFDGASSVEGPDYLTVDDGRLLIKGLIRIYKKFVDKKTVFADQS